MLTEIKGCKTIVEKLVLFFFFFQIDAQGMDTAFLASVEDALFYEVNF